jgi:integrase/recombinase XerD
MEYNPKKIYGEAREKLYGKQIEKLEQAEIGHENKTLIKSFGSYLFTQECGDLRVGKLTSQLRKVCEIIKKPFPMISIEDVEMVISYLNTNTKFSEETKADYKRAIKQFFKWYKKNDERIYSPNFRERMEATKFYEFLDELKRTSKGRQIDPGTIITEEDVNKVIQSCTNFRDKAMLKFLHETGVRVGELLNMQLRDIEIRENSASIVVDGKTGMRKIPITKAVPYLVRLLEIHPYKDDPNAFVWLGKNRASMHSPLQYVGCKRLISRAFVRAEVNKKHNPHWFRHSRASLLAPRLPESLLCKYMGWTLGSKQVKCYVHLCNQQLDDAYLKMHGLKEENHDTDNPIKCGCGIVNDAASRYCYKCGRPLNVEIAIEDEENKKNETNKTIKLLMEIMQNPELMRRFEEFKKTI